MELILLHFPVTIGHAMEIQMGVTAQISRVSVSRRLLCFPDCIELKSIWV
jgi:hypothetical protein